MGAEGRQFESDYADHFFEIENHKNLKNPFIRYFVNFGLQDSDKIGMGSKLWIVLGILSFVPSQHSLAATVVQEIISCPEIYGTGPKPEKPNLAHTGIASLPGVNTYPLPKAFMADLKNSASIKLLQALYGNGENLSLGIFPDFSNFEKTGTFTSEAGKGEISQALFLAKTLRELAISN